MSGWNCSNRNTYLDAAYIRSPPTPQIIKSVEIIQQVTNLSTYLLSEKTKTKPDTMNCKLLMAILGLVMLVAGVFGEEQSNAKVCFGSSAADCVTCCSNHSYPKSYLVREAASVSDNRGNEACVCSYVSLSGRY